MSTTTIMRSSTRWYTSFNTLALLVIGIAAALLGIVLGPPISPDVARASVPVHCPIQHVG